MVAPGTIFALFAGVYYWFPKATGRMMNETLGKIHFVGSFVCMNVIFMPMFIMGLAGVSRRLFDGGATYALCAAGAAPERRLELGRWVLAIFQIPFIVNFFWSIYGAEGRRQPVGGDDPGVGGALAAAPRQFPRARRSVPGPLRVQRPGAAKDFSPQSRRVRRDMDIPYTVRCGPTPGSTTARSASGCSWPPR